MRTTKLAPLFFVALLGTLAGCPAQGRPSYDPCERNTDCLNGDACVSIAFPYASGLVEKSMCTRQRCVVDSDCALDARGTAGACLGFAGAQTTCFERCTARANCAEGWSCESVSPPSGDVRVCVPVP